MAMKAHDKVLVRASDISFEMSENMDDNDGAHETPVRGIAPAAQMRSKNEVEDQATLRQERLFVTTQLKNKAKENGDTFAEALLSQQEQTLLAGELCGSGKAE